MTLTPLLNFSEKSDTSTSLITGVGDFSIPVVTIDSTLNGDVATFLKMDIEGAELQALVGAKETIKKYKPRLAICIYHKLEDIVTIPEYILSLVPEYKFYIRHHHPTIGTETVLYAV